MRLTVASGLLLAAVLASSPVSQAQPYGRPPPLPVLLQLRTEQAGAWRAYRDELALERSEGAAERQAAEQLNAMSTPQRLDWMLAQLPARAAAARRQAQATRAFYAVLSPEQKRAFDRITQTPVAPPPPLPPTPVRRLVIPPS